MALLETHGGVTVEDNEIRLYGSTSESVNVLRLKFSRGVDAILVPSSYDKDDDAHFDLTVTTDLIEFDEVFVKWSESETRTSYESDRNADSTQTITSNWIFPWSELVGIVFENRVRKEYVARDD